MGKLRESGNNQYRINRGHPLLKQAQSIRMMKTI